jgi:hypothetical protein
VKNTGITAAWIAGILLLGWLLFFFTTPLRNNALIQSVNRALSQTEETRRLERLLPKSASGLGNWYTVSGSENKAIVFSIMNDGMLIPCIAFVGSEKVEIVPLDGHAQSVFKRLPEGTINLYKQRIEKEYKK